MNIITSVIKKVASFVKKAFKEIEICETLRNAMNIKGGYSTESLKKFYQASTALIEFYMALPIDALKICITNGNTKIGKVMNVSLLPIFTCLRNCEGCRFFCYDIKACLRYHNVLKARVRNTVLLWRDRNAYFDAIEKRLARRRKNLFFRWHVSGDIIDGDYFERMVEIARKFPKFRFWTYTKQYSIINGYCEKYGKDSIPENLSIMFSEWDGIELINPFGFPVFHVVDDIKEAKTYICPGNCEICLKNGRGCPFAESATVQKH